MSKRRIYRCSKCGQPKKGHECAHDDSSRPIELHSRGDIGVLTRRGRKEIMATSSEPNTPPSTFDGHDDLDQFDDDSGSLGFMFREGNISPTTTVPVSPDAQGGSDSESGFGRCEWCFRAEWSCERAPCACREQAIMLAEEPADGEFELVDIRHDESTWYNQVLSPNKKRGRGEDSADEHEDMFHMSGESSLSASAPPLLGSTLLDRMRALVFGRTQPNKRGRTTSDLFSSAQTSSSKSGRVRSGLSFFDPTNRALVGYCRICEEKVRWGVHSNNHFLHTGHWMKKRCAWFGQATNTQPSCSVACVIPQDFFLMTASSGSYWVVFKVPTNTTVQQMDQFLRDMWLGEPCAHSSQFRVVSSNHQMLPADPIKAMLESDRTHSHTSAASLGSLVVVGDALEYTYDQRCPTEVHLEVLALCVGTQDPMLEKIGEVEVLARNIPPRILCQGSASDGSLCHRPAARVCLICESGGNFFCTEVGHKTCSHKTLPLLNSPRMGCCSYEYPCNDLPPPLPSELVDGTTTSTDIQPGECYLQ